MGNIAASHSANTLSDKISQPVHIISPGLDFLTINTLSGSIDDTEKPALVVSGDLLEGISGRVILIFPSKHMLNLSNLLEGDSGKENKEISKENIRPVQEMGHIMISSFSSAISDFFGVTVKAGNFFSGFGKVDDILNHLKEQIKEEKGKSVFVNTNFILPTDLTVCQLFLSLTEDDLNRLMGAEIPDFSDEFESLTDMVGAFDDLTKIESTLNDYIVNLTVPREEKRKFLRSIIPQEFEKNRLRKLIRNMLVTSKVGKKIKITQVAPYEYQIKVEGCNICDIFPTEGTRSCYTTATALGRLFMENLNIGNEVEEIKCVKTGDPACVYRMKLESIDVFSIMPVENDIKILKCLSENIGDMKEIIKTSGIKNEDGIKSIFILEYYGLITTHEDIATLTDTGRVFLNFADTTPVEEEPLEDWDDLKIIEQKIQTLKAEEPAFEPDLEESKPPWE